MKTIILLDPKSSTIPKNKNHEENYTKADHNHTVEKPVIKTKPNAAKMKKDIWDKDKNDRRLLIKNAKPEES